MDVFEAIASRRSIRRYKNQPVPRELVERLLKAATEAPSGKNLQPWRFVVLQGEKKNRVAAALNDAARRLRQEGRPTGGAQGSARVMAEAPVLILVYDPYRNPAKEADKAGRADQFSLTVDIQSVGAAIQNLLLAARALGLGTLWVCDILLAEREVAELVGRKDQALIAAVAVGYADEAPSARPRRPWPDVTQWAD